MALQGDLESFALPDVLRLLAGTSKSGKLTIQGSTASGEVDLRDGRVAGGSASTATRASEPADVVYELLRLESGSFDFDDSVEPAEGPGSSVDQVLADAQQLVADWAEVEKVVPSVDSWVTLRPEIEADEVPVTADQWRLVAALGAGSSVRSVAERFDVTDLAASQQVRGLIEAGLAELGEAGAVAVDEPAVVADEGEASVTDSALLAAEDGPVVLESSGDALLPEPLPGEGTSFAGDLDELASVDGRAFDPIEPVTGGPEDPSSETETVAAQTAELGDPAVSEEPAEESEPAEQDIWASTDSVDPDADAITDETWATAGWDDNPPVDHLSEAEASRAGRSSKGSAGDEEGDRGSLMKFLSSVKN